MSVLIPFYNEAGNIQPLIDEVHAALAGVDYEIVCVNDASGDTTGAELIAVQAASPDRIKIDVERATHWVGVGAQPTDRVARFLDALGVKERAARNNPNKAVPGKKAADRAEDYAHRF